MGKKKDIKILYEMNQILKNLGKGYFIFNDNIVIGVNEKLAPSDTFGQIKGLPESLNNYRKNVIFVSSDTFRQTKGLSDSPTNYRDNVIFISSDKLYSLFKDYKNSQISELYIEGTNIICDTDDDEKHIFGNILNINNISEDILNQHDSFNKNLQIHLKEKIELSDEIVERLMNYQVVYLTKDDCKFIASKPVITNLKRKSKLSATFINNLDIQGVHTFKIIISNKLDNDITLFNDYLCTKY